MDILRNIWVVALGAALTLICIISGRFEVTVLAFFVYSLVLVAVRNDRGFAHPISVFALFFMPYSSLYVLGLYFEGHPGNEALTGTVLVSLIAITSYAAGSFFMESFGTRHVGRLQLREGDGLDIVTSLIIYISLFLMLCFIVGVLASGYASKREIVDNSSFAGYANILSFIATAGIGLRFSARLYNSSRRAYIDNALVLAVAVMLMGFVILGERDYLFRMGFVLVGIYASYKKNFSTKKMLLLLTLMVVIMPLTTLLKAAAIVTSGSGVQMADVSLFSSEFTSAGRNTYNILYYGVNNNWAFLITDLVRGLLPFSSSFGLTSTVGWYNEIYRYQIGMYGTSGWGFSLAAQGYLIGKYIGVVVLFFIIGSIITSFYKRRNISPYWHVFYLMLLASLIYAIRADFANFLAQGVKVSGLAVLVFYVAKRIAAAPSLTKKAR